MVGKVVTDLTGFVQTRHPAELGGLYWTLSMTVALGSSFGSAAICYRGGGGEEVTGIPEMRAWLIVSWLSGAWLLVFALFLKLMKKKFRGSFFTTTTGRELSMNYFLIGTDDKSKAQVFTRNKTHWRSIGDKVKEWVLENGGGGARPVHGSVQEKLGRRHAAEGLSEETFGREGEKQHCTGDAAH